MARRKHRKGTGPAPGGVFQWSPIGATDGQDRVAFPCTAERTAALISGSHRPATCSPSSPVTISPRRTLKRVPRVLKDAENRRRALFALIAGGRPPDRDAGKRQASGDPL